MKVTRWVLVVATIIVGCGVAYLFQERTRGTALPPAQDVREPTPEEMALPFEGLVDPNAARARELADAILFSTQDCDGRPLANAGLTLVGEQAHTLLGRTSSSGELIVHVPRWGTNLIVTAALDEYELETVLIQPPYPSRVDIVLEASAHIAGRVVYADGQPVGEGYLVVAWPARHAVRAAQLSAALADPRSQLVPHTLTRADGSFRLDGLSPSEVFRVAAANDGFLSTGWNRLIHPGDEGVIIRVCALYGLVLHLVHPDGGPPRSNPLLYGKPGPVFKCDAEDVARVWTPNEAVVLAGINADAVSTRTVHQTAIIYQSLSTAERQMGPVYFKVGVPGYEFVEKELWLPRVTGELPIEPVPLVPRVEKWGTLIVGFIGAQPVDGVIRREFPVGTIDLRNKAGDKYEFAVRQFGDLDFAGIPHGEYKVQFRASNRLFSWPFEPEVVQISDIPAVFVPDVSSLGNVDIALSSPGGEGYVSKASFNIRKEGQLQEALPIPARFEEPPYVVEGLPSGTYIFEFSRLWEKAPNEPRTATVDVQPLRTSTLLFALE